jgi:hypothetical protein
MERNIVKFKDSEFGDVLVKVSFDESKSNFKNTMDLALKVLYLDYEYSTYEDLKEDYPELTQELYDICMDILDGGSCGITADRFCKFLQKAFCWKCEAVDYVYVIDVENGDWY